MKTLFKMAQSWVDVPFRWHGFSKNGCDCFGLVIGVLKEQKILSIDFFNKFKKYKYGNNLSMINFTQMINDLNEIFEETNNILNCDLLLIKCKNSPIHFIIIENNNNKIINNRKILHITQEVGKVFITNFDENLKIQKMFKLKNN